jgi:pimeloyl-ACP methyl ester carboxylesterase
MQDIMFATVLYVAMICFVCCLRYQPSFAATVAIDTADLLTDEPQPGDINPALTDEPEQMLESAPALVEDSVAPVIEPVLDADDTLLLNVGTLDPSGLTLRQCRVVIRFINQGLPKEDRIRQKINGKDAPTTWLCSQIARYLEVHPAQAMAVEEVLKAG